jgi:formiminotetrahydrofolate cyclodeaminase
VSRESLGATPVKSLLADVSAGSLAPGGISMAALAGGMAAALVGLVARLTAGKPGYEPMTEEMERLLERAKVLEEQVLGFMDQEVEAFNKLIESAALPRGAGDHDEQTVIRRDMMRISARGYTQVPLQIGQIATELLQLAESVVRYGNREVVADAGAALLMAVASAKAASLHVLINLQGQDDEWAVEARERVGKWLDALPGIERELWAHLLVQVGGTPPAPLS